jgi:hypothetical protein
VSDEFKKRLLNHARTVVDRSGRAQSEEATKQFLILPFLQLLGYNPLDPDEIIPEADASFSDKFKNRVDYAISKEGVPVIAVEAKKVGSLSTANRGELKGYYNAVTTVKLGILTDGLMYQFYSDTERYRQELWIGFSDHAATFSSLPSTSSPFSNLAPALTSATK